MAKYKVLSTKKLLPSLIEQAKQNDIEIIEQEFISVRPILSEEKFREVMFWMEQEGLNHIVFTSANAVQALQKYLHQGGNLLIPNWKVFAISGKTKDSLHPFIPDDKIIATADNSKALAQIILEQGANEVIFFCGNKRRDELPSILKDSGIKVREVVVYETIETPVVVNKDVDGILFFSPSAVQSFFSANQLRKHTACFAIGQTTADRIVDFTDNPMIVSESPSQEMMMASVQFYFQN
jgi:uroporphyrinogen-III synthase